MIKRKKILVLALISIVLVGGIFLSIFISSNNTAKIKTTIFIVPSDAKLVLDNGVSISNGINMLTPGNHTITASRTGFKSKTLSLIVQKESANILASLLDTSSDVGTKYIQDSPGEITKLETLGSQSYSSNSATMGNNYPIITQLPLDISPEYRIDYGMSIKYPNDPSKIALYISADSSPNKHAALQAIYLFGYDPSDYEIIFQPLETNS